MKKFSTASKTLFAILWLIFSTSAAALITTPYPKNELKFGFYNRGFIYLDCPHPPSPIFWTAKTKVKSGTQLAYQRLIYQNDGRFGIFIGSNFSRYRSIDTHYFYALSIYPSLRYWFVRSQSVDFYFEYSVAGPTLLTRRVVGQIDSHGQLREKDLGAYFIFQDFLGLGAVIGKSRAFTIDVRLIHYSNGDIFPENPGLDVPIMIYLGWSF